MKIQKCKITGAQVFVFIMSNLDRKTHRALRSIRFAQSLCSTLAGFDLGGDLVGGHLGGDLQKYFVFVQDQVKNIT